MCYRIAFSSCWIHHSKPPLSTSLLEIHEEQCSLLEGPEEHRARRDICWTRPCYEYVLSTGVETSHLASGPSRRVRHDLYLLSPDRVQRLRASSVPDCLGLVARGSGHSRGYCHCLYPSRACLRNPAFLWLQHRSRWQIPGGFLLSLSG